MKLIKDLCIGDKIYQAQKEIIIERTIHSINLNKTTDIISIVSGDDNTRCKGTKDSYLLNGDYSDIYFTDIKQAKIKQTELRKEHFKILLDTVEKANKALVDFVSKYSILK